MKILGIDLGKFKSVACLLNTETNQSEYETIPTQVWSLEQLLQSHQPDKVVIETCTISWLGVRSLPKTEVQGCCC